MLAGLSGTYLLISIPVPDPLPFIDEALALLVFVNATSYLGYNVRRWLPFFGKAKRAAVPVSKGRRGVTIDV